MAKNIFDIVKNQYSESLDANNNVVFHNKLTGANATPDQIRSSTAIMFKKMGLDPEQYGLGPVSDSRVGPPVTQKPGQQTVKPGTQPQGTVESTTGTEKPVEPGKQKEGAASTEGTGTGVVDLSSMNLGQLRDYYAKNPKEAGINAAEIQQKIDFFKDRSAKLSSMGNSAGATQADALAQQERTRLDTLLDKAADYQGDINKETNRQIVAQSGDYLKEITKRNEGYALRRANLERLADIYSQYAGGRAAPAMAELNSWGKGIFGSNFAKSADAGNFDEAMKIAMTEVVSQIAQDNLLRAPKAGMDTLKQTVAGPTLDPGATYALIGRTLGEMDYVHQRDTAYTDKHSRMSPAQFLTQYDRNNAPNIKTHVAQGLNSIPSFKDMSPDIKRSLYQTYGEYGYDPTGGKKTGATAPATPATTTARPASPAASNEPAAPAAPNVPASLIGKEGVQFSASKKQYRDAQGNTYDLSGTRVQ
jgi:hypothetical protein